MVLGLAAPTAGRALVDGKPFRELAEPARSVGAVLAGGAFHEGFGSTIALMALYAGLLLAIASLLERDRDV